MIAAWMLSAMLVGALVTAGAMAADRVLTALRRQTRYVWLGAMTLTLAWPLLAYARARAAEGSTASAPLRSSVQQMTAIVVRASEQSLHVRADVLLLIVWSLLSAILLARMLVTLRTLQTNGRGWRATQVDGVHVRLSRDVGPAVVGLDPMEVVLPEWALELEAPLRALVLAHEEEHRRARDPHLLLLTAALVVLVPWNPALWLQSRRLRLAIELDCDARVLRSHPRPERYGLLLLAIAQRRTAGTHVLAPALSEPTSNLERRINAMNNPLKNESRVRLAVLGGVAVALVAIACAVDAPVAPVAHVAGTVRAEPEGPRPLQIEALVADSQEARERAYAVERGYARTVELPNGKLTTVWMRDSAGKLVKVAAKIDPNGRAREEEELLAKYRNTVDGPHRETPNGPIIERGTIAPSRRAEQTPVAGRHAGEQVAPTRVPEAAAMYEFQVETARWIAGTGTPTYPAELKLAGVEGEVLASFVVDVDGHADSTTLKLLKSTNEQFADAVRRALPNMRFTPAEVGGRSVKQLIQQSFQFSVK